MQVPRLEKIVLNMGVGEAVNDRKKVARAGDWTSHPEVRDAQTALLAVQHLVAAPVPEAHALEANAALDALAELFARNFDE